MKVATWNVNSVKARHERLLSWLERHNPDILCLQELKVEGSAFPYEQLQRAGYEAGVRGQRAYNGVAILSKDELRDVVSSFDDGQADDEARFIAATIRGVRVVCVYVPNGQEVGSEKYFYKLDWLTRLRVFLQSHHAPSEPLLLCGDFNCAPDERDINRIEQWTGTVLCDEKVRASVRELEAWGLTDLFRYHVEEGGYYSWWDYRMLGFPKNNGLRIDMIFGTPAMVERSERVWMDREERKGKKPSDHVPVVVEFR